MSDLTLSISLSRKVNLGNYESADVFVSISGATAGTTTEEVEGLLSNRIVWDALKLELNDRIEEIRDSKKQPVGAGLASRMKRP